jgi:WD40 repeat protein
VAALLVVSAVAALALVGAGVAWLYNTRLADAWQDAEAQHQRAEEALKDARFYQYFHHIALAHAGWREGNLVGVEQLLDDCPSGQRNWEWHHLERLCNAHSRVLARKDLVIGMAISPDGQRIACGSLNKTVWILDAVSGKEIHVLQGHNREVADVAFSPDGRRLASSGFDGTIKVWEVANGREVFTCQGHKDTVWQVTFSPDGTRFASACQDRTVRLWDARTGQASEPVLHHPNGVWGVAFSPDGRQIVSGSEDEAVRLWEVATGRIIRTFERTAVGAYSPVAFSPDGRRIVSAEGDGTLKIWDAATGSLEHRLSGHRSNVWSVTFSPNGHEIASSGIDQTVRIWDVASGQQLQALKGPTMEITRVAYHPDGSWLASSSADGSIRAWPATIAQEARVLQGPGGPVGSLAYSPDGARLASTARDRTVTIRDSGTGQVMQTFTYQFVGLPSTDALLVKHPPVAYSPDGSRIAAGAPDGTIPVWDTRTGQLLQQQRLHTGGVWTLAYSPDGTRLASAGENATVLLWEAATGQLVHKLTGHTDQVTRLAFNPDGSRLASSSLDNTVMIWDATTGKAIDTLRGHDSWVMGIAFNRDGTRLASASNDDCVIVWDPATGRQVRKLNHASLVWSATFSPDGQRLVSCSDDGTVKIWEVATGLETVTLRGHTTSVACLSFSPDGTRLATGCHDGTMRIWDARPWTKAAEVEAPLEREALGRLDYLFNKPLRKSDVLDYLNKTTGITSQARRIALELAERYREETDPERYYQASWDVVRRSYLNAFQYRFALQQAKTACQLAPEQGRYRIALGAAQYRAGHYKEARPTLEKAHLLHRADLASLAGLSQQPMQMLVPLCQAQPLRQAVLANLAFLAMTHHQLGQQEQAQATLVRLREAAQQAPGVKDDATRDLLRETETLLGRKGAGPAK